MSEFSRTAEFLKGFLVGQVVLVVTALLLVHFLFLAGPFETRRERTRLLEQRRNKKSQTQTSKATLTSPSHRPSNASLSTMSAPLSSMFVVDPQVLQWLHYSPGRTAPESCQWLSVLLAQWLSAYRLHPTAPFYWKQWLENRLNSLSSFHSQTPPTSAPSSPQTLPPSSSTAALVNPNPFSVQHMLGPVAMREITMGQQPPHLSQARVNVSEHGRLRLEVDLEWSDVFQIALTTQLYLNWPVGQVASLPVDLMVHLKRLHATLALEWASTEWVQQQQQQQQQEEEEQQQQQQQQSGEELSEVTEKDQGKNEPQLQDEQPSVYVMVTCLHQLEMEWDVRSLLGYRTKVKDLAKVQQLVSHLLQMQVEEALLWPNVQYIRLPLLPASMYSHSQPTTPSRESG